VNINKKACISPGISRNGHKRVSLNINEGRERIKNPKFKDFVIDEENNAQKNPINELAEKLKKVMKKRVITKGSQKSEKSRNESEKNTDNISTPLNKSAIKMPNFVGIVNMRKNTIEPFSCTKLEDRYFRGKFESPSKFTTITKSSSKIMSPSKFDISSAKKLNEYYKTRNNKTLIKFLSKQNITPNTKSSGNLLKLFEERKKIVLNKISTKDYNKKIILPFMTSRQTNIAIKNYQKQVPKLGRANGKIIIKQKNRTMKSSRVSMENSISPYTTRLSIHQ